MCLLEMRGQIVSATIDRWFVVAQVQFRCEPMRERGGFVNSQIHTHTYTRITNYTKISLVGVCVHVCIVERTR